MRYLTSFVNHQKCVFARAVCKYYVYDCVRLCMTCIDWTQKVTRRRLCFLRQRSECFEFDTYTYTERVHDVTFIYAILNIIITIGFLFSFVFPVSCNMCRSRKTGCAHPETASTTTAKSSL